MTPKLGETIVVGFTTYNEKGEVADADSAPVCQIFGHEVDAPILNVPAVKRGAILGSYRVTLICSSGNGFTPGLSYNVDATATIQGFFTRATVHSFQIQSGVLIDLAQPLPDVKSATVGGGLAGAWAVSWGRSFKDVVNRLLKFWGPGNVTETPTQIFTIDSGTNPTNRTPV